MDAAASNGLLWNCCTTCGSIVRRLQLRGTHPFGKIKLNKLLYETPQVPAMRYVHSADMRALPAMHPRQHMGTAAGSAAPSAQPLHRNGRMNSHVTAWPSAGLHAPRAAQEPLGAGRLNCGSGAPSQYPTGRRASGGAGGARGRGRCRRRRRRPRAGSPPRAGTPPRAASALRAASAPRAATAAPRSSSPCPTPRCAAPWDVRPETQHVMCFGVEVRPAIDSDSSAVHERVRRAG